MRRAAAVALATVALASVALAGAMAPAPARAGLLATARLEGAFTMSGRVTDALNVAGEHRGERVRRTWTFHSPCPAGACSTVALRRTRSRTDPAAFDQLTLRRRSPGFYKGTATFLAPVRCAARRYANGEAVPFSITVRVTAAQVVGGQLLASRVRAFYANPKRLGLTRCVTAPAHDAARYTGRLVIPPAQSTRTEPSTAPSVAS